MQRYQSTPPPPTLSSCAPSHPPRHKISLTDRPLALAICGRECACARGTILTERENIKRLSSFSRFLPQSRDNRVTITSRWAGQRWRWWWRKGTMAYCILSGRGMRDRSRDRGTKCLAPEKSKTPSPDARAHTYTKIPDRTKWLLHHRCRGDDSAPTQRRSS